MGSRETATAQSIPGCYLYRVPPRMTIVRGDPAYPETMSFLFYAHIFCALNTERSSRSEFYFDRCSVNEDSDFPI